MKKRIHNMRVSVLSGTVIRSLKVACWASKKISKDELHGECRAVLDLAKEARAKRKKEKRASKEAKKAVKAAVSPGPFHAAEAAAA